MRAYLVEDNVAISDSLISAMDDMANVETVGIARSQAEAEAWLARHPGEWDVLIIDLFLEEGSGLGVVKKVATRRPGQQVIVLTNYAEVAEDEALTCGADAVFDKLTGLELFLEHLRQGRQENDLQRD
ncbi:Response regulator receiver domain-containing protein [Burkholderiales bacterium 8X]|nr:Response regulator receiver domain-containing protein [Burkholderiales bacterium 8X]